jgi:hypothetical protein
MREVEQILWNFKVPSHLFLVPNFAASGVIALKIELDAYKSER